MSEVRRVNTHNKNIKPWFDKDEWKRVYELLFNSTNSILNRQALVHLNVWKSRVDALPSAIEGTIIILEALNRNKSNYTNLQLREVHSFTILRFLNVCVASRSKQGDFKKAAISQNIPKWIIEIRNDISHDQKLPSLVCLDVALNMCLQWLKTYYWDAEYAAKKDFVPKPIDTRKIEALIQIYFNILVPDYNHDEIVNILTKLNVSAEISRRNLKKVVMDEIALNLIIPEDSVIVLCTIIISSFIARYLADIHNAEKVSLKMLDEIIIFLYENNFLCAFIEVLLKLNKRHYQDHVLYFYSKVLERLFNSLHNVHTAERQYATLIQFKASNGIKFAKLHDLYDSEILNPMPNNYTFNYMPVFSKLLGYSDIYITSLTPAIMMKNISGVKLDKDCDANDNLDHVNIFNAKSNDSIMEIEVNEINLESAQNCGNVWSIVKDTSIFKKCALGDYPAIFRESAADALYNYIK